MKLVISNIEERDVTYFGFRVEPHFAQDIILAGMLDKEKMERIFQWKTCVRWMGVGYEFYQVKSDLKAMEEELAGLFDRKGVSYAERLVKECIKAGDFLQRASLDIAARSRKVESKKDLADLLGEYFKVMTDYTPFYSLAMFEGPVMEIADELVRKYSEDEASVVFLLELLTTSARVTAVERERDALLKLAAMGEFEKRKVLADQHAKKYGWLSVRFFLGESWTGEDVEARLKEVDVDRAETMLAERLSGRQEREVAIEQATKDFNLEDRKKVRLVREIVFLRNQRADYYNESGARIRPLLDKIAGAFGVCYVDLVSLSADEILLALKGEFDYRKHIERRKKRLIVYYAGVGEKEVLDGEEAEDFLEAKSWLERQTGGVEEIEGKIGHPGLTKGEVKVVRYSDDIGKVKKGDILVTAMTIPNFMPALERAVAFVTDEGGITCHAAIIAREMKKPCIIGTKIATQVLKDGDMVEVDADKGVVRKV